MEELLPKLLSFPPHPPQPFPILDESYDAHVKDLLQVLNKTPASLLASEISGASGLLDILDPSINSLPYLYALIAHLRAAVTAEDALSSEPSVDPTHTSFGKAVNFLERFDSRQIRYAGNEWRKVVEMVASSARAYGKPLLAVRPLRNAILRLDPTSSTFTTTHRLFVQLCLEAKAFRAALPVIDQDILDFPASNPNIPSIPATLDQPSSLFITPMSGLSGRVIHSDHLEYHLYGAMIYMGLKKWDRALEFLEFVIASPTQHTTSKIMVEAYKKWVLATLIHHRRLPVIPRCTNASAIRSYHTLSRPYDQLASRYANNLHDGTNQLGALIASNSAVWAEDQNTGLVAQVQASLLPRHISQLATTHSSLSLPHIAATHNRPLPDLDATLFGLIATGRLPATLSHHKDTPTFLRFREPTSQSDQPSSEKERAMLAATEEQMARIVRLNEQTKEMERRFALRSEVVEVLAKEREKERFERSRAKGKPKDDQGLGEAMDMEWAGS